MVVFLASGEGLERNGSSEEEADLQNNLIDPQAEDRELKGQLLRKYSGYLGSLKQEFMKKRKKGKLPKEARQQLLDWWSRHYKWPYPSVSLFFALLSVIVVTIFFFNFSLLYLDAISEPLRVPVPYAAMVICW